MRGVTSAEEEEEPSEEDWEDRTLWVTGGHGVLES